MKALRFTGNNKQIPQTIQSLAYNKAYIALHKGHKTATFLFVQEKTTTFVHNSMVFIAHELKTLVYKPVCCIVGGICCQCFRQ